MHPPRRAISEAKNQRGFALLIVIGIAGLLSFAAIAFASSVRTHMRVVDNGLGNMRAGYAAESGISLGTLSVIAAAEREERPDLSSRRCTIDGDTRIMVALSDEAGRVDFNLAEPALLSALLRSTGVDRASAERIAEAVAQQRRSDEVAPVSSEQRSTRRGPFLTLDDVRAVDGLDQAVFDAIRPYATVRSGQQGIDLRVAPQGLGPRLAATINGSDELPPAFRGVSTGEAYLVRSVARTASGAVAVREAVISARVDRPPLTNAQLNDPGFGLRGRSRTTPGQRQRYVAKVWEWRTAAIADSDLAALAVPATWPEC
ncbi:MAG: hypothetical protein RL291_1130 [Pseudomonadota bacterium]